MTRSQARKVVLTAAVTALALGVSYALTMQPLPPDAGSTCATSLTAAEFNSWFDAGVVTLDGLVKPADSVLFPNTPNCSFYKWSEQMFLWLTSPATPEYGGGGLVMNTPVFYDVSLPDDSGRRHFLPHKPGTIRAFNLRTPQKGALGLPVVIEHGTLRILEVLPPVLSRRGKQLVGDRNGNQVEVGSARFTTNAANGGALVLLDVSGMEIQGPRALLSPEIEKKLAGMGNFDTSELVQKISVGDKAVFLDLVGNVAPTEQGQADGGVLMSQNGSLVYYALTVNNVFALYRTMQGASVPAGTQFPLTQPDLNAILAFAAANGQPPVIDSEALAIEIKSSWVEAASLGPDAKSFIQMPAIVPTYDKTDPKDWVPNGTQVMMLAMVGMHIVGSTAGHPEMLWSTFEHLSNDPAATYNYARTPSGTGTVPQNTVGSWVFTANGAAAPFNEKHMQMGPASHILAIPPFKISPSNVLRTMPWGLPGGNAVGNAEVISINNTVRALLHPADIRRNYFHEGTTWTIGGAPPNGFNQVGTNKLENTTLETFFQNNNCFSCHATNTTTVSHIFNDTDPLF
jgi:hypothetical protein